MRGGRRKWTANVVTRRVWVGSLALLAALFGLGAAILYDDDEPAVAEPLHTPAAPADRP